MNKNDYLTALIASVSCLSLDAGMLQETYINYLESEPELEAANYRIQASEQYIQTQQRNYLPKVTANAKELFIGQDIQQDNNVYEQGSDTYGATRAKIELDQPLIDLTIKPKIEAAQALRNHRQKLHSADVATYTQLVLESYVQTAQCFSLENSYERVISHLESELKKVSQSFEEKQATVEDVENIKVALAAAKQDMDINRELLEFHALNIGIELETIEEAPFLLNQEPNLSTYAESKQELDASERVEALKSELIVYDKKITALKKRDLPRLSLYGLYQYDDAGGSEFGGKTRLNEYEVGISVDWDIFDRGITRSESKELLYLKRAKEAEVRAFARKDSRLRQNSYLSAKRALANLTSLEQIVEHKKTILNATERSHTDGGTESYISMVNSFLIYESQVRQLESGRYDCLTKQIRYYGLAYGWNEELVSAVDTLFVATR